MEKLKDFVEFCKGVARLTEAQVYAWFAAIFSKKDKDE